ARVGLFDKPDDLLGAESALLHVRPLGFTDFIASAGTAQWGQVSPTLFRYNNCRLNEKFNKRVLPGIDTKNSNYLDQREVTPTMIVVFRKHWQSR
ncbi:hypothetical protein ABVE18_23870, partial [Xanthomonas euvesicatoria]